MAVNCFQPLRGAPVTKVKQFEPHAQVAAPLRTPTDLSPDAVNAISAALNALLADTFAFYLKTKNFHWHVSGPHSATTICCSTSNPTRFSK